MHNAGLSDRAEFIVHSCKKLLEHAVHHKSLRVIKFTYSLKGYVNSEGKSVTLRRSYCRQNGTFHSGKLYLFSISYNLLTD